MRRILTLLVCLFVGSQAFAATLSEKQKIDALLNAFDTPGITFVRNGESHDGAWAKQHLQEKLEKAQPPITTAQDFIDKIASKSSHTDKPYIIKMKDGKEQESGKWLSKKLKEMK